MPGSSLEHKLTQYQPTDSSNFSSSDLSRSYWLVTHKIFFRNVLIGFLLIIDVLLAGYGIFGFGSYLFFGRSAETGVLADLARRVNSSTISNIQARAAQPLQYGGVRIFDNGNSRFDFVAELQNPNPGWYALVTFNFDIEGSTSTASHTAFVLPGEHKYLTALGEQRDEASISDASLHIVNEMWSRIDTHEIEDVPQFVQSHLAFSVDNPEFVPPTPMDITSGENMSNEITFDITNNSAFNYWSVPVQVVLMRGGQVEGIQEIKIDKFRTAQARSMSIRDFTQGLVVDEVRVLPSVDIFDPSVYMSQ